MILTLALLLLQKKEIFLTLVTVGFINYLIIGSNHFLIINRGFLDAGGLFIIILTWVVIYLVTPLESSIKISLLSVIFISVFSRIYVLQFYTMYELSLFPIFLIIYTKSKQYERIQAGLYLIFYTLIFSLPLLIMLFNITSYNLISNYTNLQSLYYTLVFVAFLVKLPIFLLHSWLPKAHVEAPVYGSIILASVILKLGGYGMLKFLILGLTISPFFLKILLIGNLVGAVACCILCLYSSDLKVIIALASVSHISMMTGSVILNYFSSKGSGLLIMLAHGFSSSFFFYWIRVGYERVKSRRIFICNGQFSYYFNYILFIVCIINFASPPFINFIREVYIFLSLIPYSKILTTIIFFYILLRTTYSMYFFYTQKTAKKVFFRSEKTLGRENILSFFHIWWCTWSLRLIPLIL